MRLASIADIQLTGKALVKGWLDDFEDRKTVIRHEIRLFWPIQLRAL